ncbi:MAG: hypothetical protein U0L37_03300 [Bacteroidales bacterium]|nr:hypothetical protein [Bacteroidales bacterium]
MNNVIELRKGYGDLLFGQNVEQVLGIIGKPSEVEQIGEEVEIPTTPYCIMTNKDYLYSLKQMQMKILFVST